MQLVSTGEVINKCTNMNKQRMFTKDEFLKPAADSNHTEADDSDFQYYLLLSFAVITTIQQYLRLSPYSVMGCINPLDKLATKSAK